MIKLDTFRFKWGKKGFTFYEFEWQWSNKGGKHLTLTPEEAEKLARGLIACLKMLKEKGHLND